MSSLEESQLEHGKKPPRSFNVYVLIFSLIVLSAILTYIIPSGQFDRVELNGRSVIEADSFQYIDSSPVGLLDLFSSVHSGMVNGASTIFFVLIIGGTFGVFAATGALDAFIAMISRKMANREKLLIPVLMLFFAIAGALMGMSDEIIVYIAILVPLTIALGFDAMTGFAMVTIGASVGFTAAVMNPFTVGIAQGIAELPPFSGMGFRIIIFIVLYVAAATYVYRYASKVKKDPSIGEYGKYQPSKVNPATAWDEKMSMSHKLVLISFLVSYIILIIGVMKYGWYITEIAGLFFMFGIIMGILGKLSPSQIADNFIIGAKDLLGGAMIIGLAQAILVIFNSAGLMDTILYHASELLGNVPGTLSAVGMFILQLIMNFFVPSGSGQAALTMPLMAPLSDMIGVTRQTSVLAFQFGDGIAKSIFPTGNIIAALAVGGISYGKWFKWFMPFFIIQFVIAVVALIIAQWIQYGPF